MSIRRGLFLFLGLVGVGIFALGMRGYAAA
jgi:hypothetical protein